MSSAVSTHEGAQAFWLRRARVLIWRFNVACWLQQFLLPSTGLTVLFAGAVLTVRQHSFPFEPLIWAYGCGLTLLIWRTWYHARSSFLNQRSALVRLESQLQLHNRLSAAAAGVGNWPVPPDEVSDGWTWNWSRLLTPPTVATFVLLSAFEIPLTPHSAQATVVTEEPLAWTQVEAWLDTLKKEEVVQPQALENLQEQLDQLRQQPKEDWYSHSSLEAGDNLKQKAEQGLRSLQKDLNQAHETVLHLEAEKNLSTQELQQLNGQMQAAMQGLQMGTLPLHPEALKELKSLDLSKAKSFSAAELKEMKERMSKSLGACSQCLKLGDQFAVGAGGDKPGVGAPTRGPGTAPITLSEQENQLGTKKTEAVANDDFKRAALGETVGVSQTEHDVDKKSYRGSTQAGAIDSNGTGGEAVWRNDLTPEERATLQRFFK